MNPTAVCRAGLALLATGAATATARAHWAGALIAAGLLLLAGGGWLTSKRGKRCRST